MSHHASGPNFGFPRGDARLDMTDLYAFPKPGDPSKSIIVLNVHPSFRLDSPEPTTSEPFKPGALYEIKVDTKAMQLPTSVAVCGSRLRETGSRLRQCAVFRACEQVAWANKVKLSSSKHQCQSERKPW